MFTRPTLPFRSLNSSVRSFSTSRLSNMPIYMCYCPDYPGALEKRLSVRGDHLVRANQDKEEGRSVNSFPLPDSPHPVFGRGFVADAHAGPIENPPNSSTPNLGMAGSLMLLRFPSLEDAWNRIKSDIYWTAGVWDKEKSTVKELLNAPGDDVAEWRQ